jgi:hypothetical protein
MEELKNELINLVLALAPSRYLLGVFYPLKYSKKRFLSINYIKFLNKLLLAKKYKKNDVTKQIEILREVQNNLDQYKTRKLDKIDGDKIYQIIEFKKTLREYRSINKKLETLRQKTPQYPGEDYNPEEIYEKSKEPLIIWFNENILSIIKAPENILKNPLIQSNIQFVIRYCIRRAKMIQTKNDNGEDIEVEVIVEEIHYTHTKAIIFDDITDNKIKPEFNAATSDVKFWEYRGYLILMTTTGPVNMNNIYDELKAYAPCNDQEYHTKTLCSTTKDRLCIYQTWLYLQNYDLKKLRKSGQHKEMLELESAEIIESVKKGSLCQSLILLTKKYNNVCYVKFYKEEYNSLKFENGIMTILEDDKELDCKKVFLYYNAHVAPSYFKIEEKSKYQNKQFYQLAPKYNKNISDTKIKVGGYDIETYDAGEGKQKTYDISVVFDDDKKSFYGIDAEEQFINYLDTIKTDMNISKTRAHESIQQIYIYGFNNSRFDNLMIYDFMLDRDPSCKLIIVGNSIKYIKYANIRIYDISLFYKLGGLRETAKTFGLEKEKGVFPYKFPNADNLNYVGPVPELKYWKNEHDYNTYIKEIGNEFNMKEYTIKYCLLDAELTKEIAKIHIKNSRGTLNGRHYNGSASPTVASLSMKMFQQCFLEDILYSSPLEIQKKERLSYKGGRNDVFKKIFNNANQKLYYYDINSSYPSSMLENMPYQVEKVIKCKETKMTIEGINSHYLYLARHKYIGNHKNFIPNMLIRYNDKLLALKESGYSYHWGCELIEAINSNCDIWITEIIKYSAKPLFKSFSEFFYNERLKNKASNPTLAMFYKNVLNNLYGKFGQAQHTHKKICNNKYEISKILSNKNHKLVNFSLIGEKLMLEYIKYDDEHTNIGSLVRFAAYITALSRCKLSKIIRNVGYEHIYYCDTDSIFTDKKPDAEFIDNNVLGKWKLEHECNKAYFIAKKTYYTEHEGKSSCKAKGITQSLMIGDDYNLLLDSTKSVEKEIMNMFFRSLTGIIIKPQIRTITSIYNSRIFKNNESFPYDNLDHYINLKNNNL